MTIREKWLQEVVQIARSAGDAIMKVYEGEIAVEKKEDNSPLTAADLAAHAVIDAGLKQLTPEIPILSEESATIPYSIRKQWPTYWLVDPLDGTREFIKRNGEFTVNIALIEGDRSVIGVVYAPARNVLYYASASQGAYKQEGNSGVEKIQARTLDIGRVTIAGSRSHSDEKMTRFLSAMEKSGIKPELMALGSSLKICLVAEGKADLYPRLGPTSEWDTAAAQCVLEVAGGQLTELNGQHLKYNSKESILNPEFFASGATPYAWNRFLE